jgi:hypothetical protein
MGACDWKLHRSCWADEISCDFIERYDHDTSGVPSKTNTMRSEDATVM